MRNQGIVFVEAEEIRCPLCNAPSPAEEWVFEAWKHTGGRILNYYFEGEEAVEYEIVCAYCPICGEGIELTPPVFAMSASVAYEEALERLKKMGRR